MIKAVKDTKAGFVKSDSNISPDKTMADIVALKKRTGHSTIAVTEDGTAEGESSGYRYEQRLPCVENGSVHKGKRVHDSF